MAKKKTTAPSGSLCIGAAYIRVSTDGQMDLSPESQLDSILGYEGISAGRLWVTGSPITKPLRRSSPRRQRSFR